PDHLRGRQCPPGGAAQRAGELRGAEWTRASAGTVEARVGACGRVRAPGPAGARRRHADRAGVARARAVAGLLLERAGIAFVLAEHARFQQTAHDLAAARLRQAVHKIDRRGLGDGTDLVPDVVT